MVRACPAVPRSTLRSYERSLRTEDQAEHMSQLLSLCMLDLVIST